MGHLLAKKNLILNRLLLKSGVRYGVEVCGAQSHYVGLEYNSCSNQHKNMIFRSGRSQPDNGKPHVYLYHENVSHNPSRDDVFLFVHSIIHLICIFKNPFKIQNHLLLRIDGIFMMLKVSLAFFKIEKIVCQKCCFSCGILLKDSLKI